MIGTCFFDLNLNPFENFDLQIVVKGKTPTADFWAIRSVVQSCLYSATIMPECSRELTNSWPLVTVSQSKIMDKADLMPSIFQFPESRFALKHLYRSLAEIILLKIW
jgi:hypothetical protein